MRHLNNHKIFVKKAVLISGILFAALVFFSVYLVNSWPQRTLKTIDFLIANEAYTQAEELITTFENREKQQLNELKKVCSYHIALDYIQQGDTQSARYRLENLSGYKNTSELLLECSYIDAEALMQDKMYEDAYLIYALLDGYKESDAMMIEARYQVANRYYNDNEFASALEIFSELKNYKDSQIKADEAAVIITGAKNIEEARQILEGINLLEMQNIANLTAARNNLLQGVLSVGAHHTIALTADGTLLAAGLNSDGQCDVDTWTGIIAVDAGMYHTVALQNDGTVVAAGRNTEGQCDVSSWENVIQIAAGAYTTYGLLEDGTIVSTGYSQIRELSNLHNIKYLNAGGYAAGCINEDGITLFSHPSYTIHETGAISLDVSTGYAVALLPDGSIASTLQNTPQWQDIIAVYAGSNMMLAIDINGSVLSHFFDSRDTVNLSGYTNVLSIAPGGSHFALLLADGSVAVFGDNEYGQCDTDNWLLFSNEN